jgi:hypothetical protein
MDCARCLWWIAMPQRDAIWQALHITAGELQPRAVLLHGTSGYGKSRLAEWMCERADELGVANVLPVFHSPAGGTGHGLTQALARHFQVQGLTPPQILDRVAHSLTWMGVDDIEEVRGLTDLLSLEIAVTRVNSLPGLRTKVIDARHRRTLIRRYLTQLSMERPLVLWVDDGQWGLAAVMLVRDLLENPGHIPCRLLAVVTIRDDAVDQGSPVERAVRAVASHPSCVDLTLGPLSSLDHRQLIEQLLHLEGHVAREVEMRTEGNPLFAVQLVGDWVRREVLQPTDSGFILKAETSVDVPDGIHALWSARIDGLLAEMSGWQVADGAAVNTALEIAALLGQRVDPVDWHSATNAAGVSIPDDLLDAMVRSRLAEPVTNGWTFVHGMLRESLERRCQDAGRAQHLHRICAQMLENRYSPDAPDIAERRAHHLWEAADYDQAAPALYKAARQRESTSDYDRALQLVERCEVATDKAGAAVNERVRLEAWAVRVRILIRKSQGDEAERWVNRLMEEAGDLGLADLEATA